MPIEYLILLYLCLGFVTASACFVFWPGDSIRKDEIPSNLFIFCALILFWPLVAIVGCFAMFGETFYRYIKFLEGLRDKSKD